MSGEGSRKDAKSPRLSLRLCVFARGTHEIRFLISKFARFPSRERRQIATIPPRLPHLVPKPQCGNELSSNSESRMTPL